MTEIVHAVVYKFKVDEFEDPDLYIASPIIDWEKSDSGKWVMDHAIEKPTWHRHVDHNVCSYVYRISAKLTATDYTFWKLKFE